MLQHGRDKPLWAGTGSEEYSGEEEVPEFQSSASRFSPTPDKPLALDPGPGECAKWPSSLHRTGVQ